MKNTRHLKSCVHCLTASLTRADKKYPSGRMLMLLFFLISIAQTLLSYYYKKMKTPLTSNFLFYVFKFTTQDLQDVLRKLARVHYLKPK